MVSELLRRTGLAAVALAVILTPLLSAPAPKPDSKLRIEKYLLDDSDGVLVVNLKQILASPGYKKGFAKQLADLVARPEAQEYLKDIGFDPLKDLEQMIVCSSKSCWSDESKQERGDGPFFLFQGKFDSAKLSAKMAALAKDHADKVTASDAPGGKKIYRIDPKNGPFAAQLDAHTIVIAGKKAHVLDALLKASGKKTTKLAIKEATVHLKKLKPDVAVQGFALPTFVMSSTYVVEGNGMGKGGGLTRRDVTLADKGFASATLSIAVKDRAEGSVVWSVKDKDQVKKLTEMFTNGLDEIRKEGAREVARRPQLAPLTRFLDAVKIKGAGQTITMEGKSDAETIQALIDSFLRFGF